MKKHLLSALALIAGSTLLAGSPEVSSGDIVQGEWNSRFNDAKALAESAHIPMLAFWGDAGCTYCKKLRSAMNTTEFKEWQAQQGLIMVMCEGTASSDAKACKSFVRNSSGTFPYVAIYWKKETGTDVLVKFTGHSSKMTVKSGSLAEQLMKSVEQALDGWSYSGSSTTEPDPEPTPTPEPDPEPTPEPEPDPTPVITDPFKGGQTYTAKQVDENGDLVGVIYLTAGKAKKGRSKLSGYAMDLAGKKYSMKAQTVTVGTGYVTANLSFKSGYPSATVSLQQATLTGTYVTACAVGGSVDSSMLSVGDLTDFALPDGYDWLADAWPSGQEFSVSGKKFVFGKAASIKYKKVDGEYELTGLDDESRPNLGNVKLSYTPATGVFKGSFTGYASNEFEATGKPKLKKYSIKITGIVIDGLGYGKATLKGVTADVTF